MGKELKDNRDSRPLYDFVETEGFKTFLNLGGGIESIIRSTETLQDFRCG